MKNFKDPLNKTYVIIRFDLELVYMAWMDDLPRKLRSSLEAILDRVEQQENVYEAADNEAVAQIWVALAQMNQRVQRLENLVKAQRKALNNLDESIDVDDQLDQKLEESLKRY